MNIRFIKRNAYGNRPCIDNEVIRWHARHGWCWDVQVDGTLVAVFYCTLLCGDGCLVHFDKAKYINVPGAVVLGVLKKAMRMVAPECDVIYATIEKRNAALIRVAVHLGFGIVPDGGFLRDKTEEVVLLKYYGRPAGYIKN